MSWEATVSPFGKTVANVCGPTFELSPDMILTPGKVLSVRNFSSKCNFFTARGFFDAEDETIGFSPGFG